MKIHKKSLLTSVGFSLFSYVFGGVNRIAAYNDGTGIPQLKVISAEIFYVLSLIGIYYTMFISIKKDKNFVFLIWPAWIIALFPVFYTLYPPFIEQHPGGILSNLYLIIGDYLAQSHNINWYYMDWGVWQQAVILYFWPLYALVIYKILALAFKFKTKKK